MGGSKHFLYQKVAMTHLSPKFYKKWNLVKFKWEWSVHFHFAENYRAVSPTWKERIQVCPSREDARIWKASYNAPFNMQYRNAVIKRRLVQVDWEEYNDSFGWNAKT